ncbi:CMRF35-like molecule 6 isoform 1-T1 [Dama dama]|uniref:CMRF35-like molecule 6 isoform X1 n=2 Tax=Dama dama TaxID=30532 RepID=UPI002A35E8BD|nr:CMRF35-like molecule 6 isoform X1 [Dama dama]XP_061000916.1 CMRF35-like molecule 6 isoform X1 [Dama dama]XP_061000920.1 CMRF35-like molecule 6 isoform X1 [Dama dama]
MTPRARAGWLPSALLLLQVPGCLSLSGPSRVTGIVGGSLSVECRYREEFINNSKYWCKFPCVLLWKIMETRESEREVRRGRVSIRDHPASLTFTVTLESLREEDAGTYVCGIDVRFSINPTFQVEVSVIPGGNPEGPVRQRRMRKVTMTTTSPERSTSTPESPTTLPVPTWSTVSGPEAPDPGQAHRPLLGSIHFLLLVFLKVPLLLGMLGAVLWVNRPLRSSADRRSRSIYENQ